MVKSYNSHEVMMSLNDINWLSVEATHSAAHLCFQWVNICQYEGSLGAVTIP